MFGMDDAAAALLLSGAMSTAGSLYATQNNAALARSQLDYQKFVNDVNWAIAAENNATQVDMANTAHQREVADLRRAGLNPILSAGGNGASVPSLTTPSGHVIGAGSPYSNPLEGAASSARSLGRFFGQQYDAQLEAQRQANVSQKLANAEAYHSLDDRIDAERTDAETDLIRAKAENKAARLYYGIEPETKSSFGLPQTDGTSIYSVDALGTWRVKNPNWDDAVRREVKALETDSRMRRGRDVLSIMPFLGTGVNSAANFVGRANNTVRATRR